MNPTTALLARQRPTRVRAAIGVTLGVTLALGATGLSAAPARAQAPALAPSHAAAQAPARAQSAAAAACTVTDAEISWGFKESFRSYISGTIANGEWTVADGASYETPSFSWSGGAGDYDGETGEGLLDFSGAVTFTGHGGILNTTLASPQVRFIDPETAMLVMDVTGTTQAGDEVNAPDVDFVELDLAGGTWVESPAGQVVFTDVPTVLTPEGSSAFGTYEAGEPFDPITVSFAQSAECAVPTVPAEPETPQPTPDAGTTDTGFLPWAVLGGLALIAAVLAAVIAAVVFAARRRRPPLD